mgnify:FL=1|tara:strand:- start:222 stop:1889 length:1668 start_codon:yes stop_codon:yes gene_type:complete
MADKVEENLIKKFLNYLKTKQYKKLQLEVNLLGKVEDQHPTIIFYYAVSISLFEGATKQELIYALDLFEKVYLVDESNHLPLHNMISLSFKTKQFFKVKKYVEEELKKNNNDLKLLEAIALINHYLGNKNESIKNFKILYKKIPSMMTGRITFITSLLYASGITQKEYIYECSKYANIIETKLDVEKKAYKFDPKVNKKIKIAFISGDFKKHSITGFLIHLLSNLNKNIFEIVLISNLKEKLQDSISEKLKALADEWHDIHNYNDNDLTKFLRSLNIDTLIDLSGYTVKNRHQVLAKRCAKIQIVWLGYNNSLCLNNLDYLIADRNLIYPNEENDYKEKIIYLPRIWNALSVPDNLVPITDEKIYNSKFTYGSFNNFKKISNDTIEVWSKILSGNDSQIILKNSFLDGNDIKFNLLNKFLKLGVKEEQIIFLDYEKREEDHYQLYNKINLSLDTFPYPGVTTSFESIIMGVPVLTMHGFNFNSRCGASINKNIGMKDLIANNYEEYISIAKNLKQDHELHLKNGNSLRERALKSALFDTKSFAKDFEKIIRDIQN